MKTSLVRAGNYMDNNNVSDFWQRLEEKRSVAGVGGRALGLSVRIQGFPIRLWSIRSVTTGFILKPQEGSLCIRA